jgi:hypothetical protein
MSKVRTQGWISTIRVQAVHAALALGALVLSVVTTQSAQAQTFALLNTFA